MNQPAPAPPAKDPQTLRRVKAVIALERAFTELKRQIKGGNDEGGPRRPSDPAHLHVG